MLKRRLSEKTGGFFYAWKQEEYIAPSYNGQYTGLSLRRRGFDSRWSSFIENEVLRQHAAFGAQRSGSSPTFSIVITKQTLVERKLIG